MSVLLVAINSKYSHTNLAVRSIANYVKSNLPETDIHFDEWTIQEPILDILRGINAYKPDVVIFSVYIWNCTQCYAVAAELKKIMPNILIGMGGPEVSYKDPDFFSQNPEVDFIVKGEGELLTLELCKILYGVSDIFNPDKKGENQPIDQIKYSLDRLKSFVKYNCILTHSLFKVSLISDLSILPFPYPEFVENQEDKLLGPKAHPVNRILYYESSRGCPFSCSYCLSSIDKTVRFMPLERVFADLQIFLDANVKLVKFVDRTFNLNENRYIKIWEYIKNHYNGKTRFHFEIAAECLSDVALDFIKDMPENSIQFEIGVQSINPQTLEEVGRKADLENLSRIINKIPKFIHVHLDLIAGLPYESLDLFKKSFDYTFRLKPNMLQLGFLKVLEGTKMEVFAKNHDFKYLSLPPYEVLETPNISWAELVFLKDIEKLNDAYWNSGYFSRTFDYLLNDNDFSPFDFYATLIDFAEKSIDFVTALSQPHKTDFWFALIFNFFAGNKLVQNLIKFDYISMGKTSVFPDWYNHVYSKDLHHQALLEHTDMHSTRLAYANSNYEEFDFNPFSYEEKNTKILFLYEKRDVIVL